MRLRLLFDPRLLCERLAAASLRQRRLKKLRGTPARNLLAGHIDSLELLELARPTGIKVIYDIGANVGTWSLLAKSIIPDATVEAFEALPKHHAGFTTNLRDLKPVTLHPVALGAKNTTAILHVTNFSDASSILPLTEQSWVQFGLKEVEQFSVQVRRLDDYQAEYKLGRPDLIKLDVQGYELEVLKGAVESLRTVKAVVTEVSFIDYYQGQCQFHDLVEFLAGFGLYLAAFGVNTPIGTMVKQTDVLFARGIRG